MIGKTYTWIPNEAHDAVKAFAALNRMKLPDAYNKIILEGLKSFNFVVDR